MSNCEATEDYDGKKSHIKGILERAVMVKFPRERLKRGCSISKNKAVNKITVLLHFV